MDVGRSTDTSPKDPGDVASEARRLVAQIQEEQRIANARISQAVEAAADAAGATATAANATAQAAQRTPNGLETFAISVASSACAIVLAGVVLIVVADAVDLVDPINIWPLATLAVAIVAIAALSLTAGRRRRAIDLIPGVADLRRQIETFDKTLNRVMPQLERVSGSTPSAEPPPAGDRAAKS